MVESVQPNTSFADAATGLKVFHTAQDHIVKRGREGECTIVANITQ